jgi:hypothetical protein
MAKKSSLRPRKATRANRFRVWIERGVLGIMMTVVAWVVERRLLKVLRSGTSSKKELQKDEREERRARASAPVDREAGVGPGAEGGGSSGS